MYKHISVLILCLFFIKITSVSNSFADDIPATTVDGRRVTLHDNGTWEFTDANEPVELRGPEQAKECVKNLPCSRGGTIEQYFTKKADISTTEDLGWHVSPKEDGFEVERSLLFNKKIKSTYKWHVDKMGRVIPLNIKGSGITKN